MERGTRNERDSRTVPRRSSASATPHTPSGQPAESTSTAQRALAEQATWALAILNDAVDGILTINDRGIVQWMNPAAETLFGYRTAEVIGQNVKMLMPPPDRDRHDSYIASYVRTGQKKIIGIGREVVGQRKDGTTFPMYLSVCESTVGGARIFGGIVRDLTRRKQVEDELRGERDFTRRLLDTAEAIVLVLDARGRIVQFNRHLERMSGRSLDGVRERDWFETFVPERERARTRWQFKQSVAGRTMRGSVYPILVREGRERQIEWFESVLAHAEGRADGLLCIGLDVTERIEAEAERHAYEEKLRSLSAELTETEERERRELATELHDQIGQTLALTKIKLGGLREAAPEALRPQVSEIGDLVDQAVQSSRSLMMELGATVLHELGLEAALAGLADETRKRHGIACAFVDDKRPKPLADQTKIALFRAVRELLMNVVKHAAAKRVEVSMERSGSSLRIRVRDDGAGFVVPGEGFHAKREGGFGLFSIQERLARLGGSMTVTSRPGAGTTVTLEAPLAQTDERAAGFEPLEDTP
jgi:PAS domain S-box-containing protein